MAHYVDGRFREVRWFVLGWFLLLLGGIFFYSGALGFLLLGLAIGLHGWIAFSHTLLAEKTEFGKRVIDYMAVLVILGLIYWGVQVVAFHDFVFGISTFTVPKQNVQTGDTLLARRSRAHDGVLPRGSLVVGNFHQLYGAHHVIRGTYETMGQVIALPGEKLEISENQFVVNGEVTRHRKISGSRLVVRKASVGYNPARFIFCQRRLPGANTRYATDKRNGMRRLYSAVPAISRPGRLCDGFRWQGEDS